MAYENKEVGKERARLEAKDVRIKEVKEVEVELQQGKRSKMVLVVEHPDLPEMEISKVKYLRDNKITESGLWLTEDKDGAIPYQSAVANLLRHCKVSTIKDLKGLEIKTDLDEKGFVIAKAY